jgi:hypothetical protein
MAVLVGVGALPSLLRGSLGRGTRQHVGRIHEPQTLRSVFHDEARAAAFHTRLVGILPDRGVDPGRDGGPQGHGATQLAQRLAQLVQRIGPHGLRRQGQAQAQDQPRERTPRGHRHRRVSTP